MLTLGSPPDFFDDEKSILKTSMMSFQLHKDRHQKSAVAVPVSALLDVSPSSNEKSPVLDQALADAPAQVAMLQCQFSADLWMLSDPRSALDVSLSP